MDKDFQHRRLPFIYFFLDIIIIMNYREIFESKDCLRKINCYMCRQHLDSIHIQSWFCKHAKNYEDIKEITVVEQVYVG